MSADPMGEHLQDPQTMNAYSYVRNNPLNLTDPTGLDPFLPGAQGCQADNGDACNPPLAPVKQTQTDSAKAQNASTTVAIPSAIQVLEQVAKTAATDIAIGVGAVGATIAIAVAELSILAPSTGRDDLSALPTSPPPSMSQQGTVDTSAVSSKADQAGGAPGAGKDRSTVQGRHDQLEGVEQARKDTTKRGGYRISKEKSEQEANHGLKQIVDGARNPVDE